MSRSARWIRLDPAAMRSFMLTCRGFSQAQTEGDAPICLWGRALQSVRLDDGLWAELGDLIFVLIVPRRFAPRPSRWLAWGLTPLLTALRNRGEHAYMDGGDIVMHGNRIAGGGAKEIAGSVVVFGTFPADPPFEPPQSGERGRLLEFDPWLDALNREGRARQMLGAFRHAVETQHGWQFDTDWPNGNERLAIAGQFAS